MLNFVKTTWESLSLVLSCVGRYELACFQVGSGKQPYKMKIKLKVGTKIVL